MISVGKTAHSKYLMILQFHSALSEDLRAQNLIHDK